MIKNLWNWLKINWKAVKFIGEGTYKVVFEVQDRQKGILVALNVFKLVNDEIKSEI